MNFLRQIRTQRPLILNLTNAVTMDFIANGLLAVGASPLMTQAEEEIGELVAVCSALVVNIGTLNPQFMHLCLAALHAAHHYRKPVILDPVGAGATAYRTYNAKKILSSGAVTVVRANASEILSLAGFHSESKGVDSGNTTDEVANAAQSLSKTYNCTVVMTGKTDYTIDAHRVTANTSGHEYMKQVTGMGCLLTSVVAAFVGVAEDGYQSACAATAFYGRCGELAAKNSSTRGPGSFKTNFIDELARE